MAVRQSGLAPSKCDTKRGALARLKRRDLEGMHHPTRGMRDLRTTSTQLAKTRDQGTAEIKRHAEWGPTRLRHKPPHDQEPDKHLAKRAHSGRTQVQVQPGTIHKRLPKRHRALQGYQA